MIGIKADGVSFSTLCKQLTCAFYVYAVIPTEANNNAGINGKHTTIRDDDIACDIHGISRKCLR